MTLKSWDQLPLQLRRNKKKLYAHLYANTNISLTAWDSLDGITRRSTIKLWNAIATKVNDTADVPLWGGLTHTQKRSRRLRWTLLYNELAGTTQRTITITVTDDEDTPSAIKGATVKLSRKTATTDDDGEASFSSVGDGNHTVKVTAEGYEDYSGTKTTDSTHTSFTIQLTAVESEEAES